MAPFTYEDDVILIENVRQNRALYDNAHRGHNDTGFKDAIWDDISVKIGKSAYQCKRRWKNIKTAYIKNKKKLETGTANGSNSAWSLSANVSFLDTVRVDHKNNAAATSNVRNGAPKFELAERVDFESAARDGDLSLPSTDTSQFRRTAGDTEKTKEDKIAIILAEGMKERNEMLYNVLQKQMEILDNTSYKVTVQYDQKRTVPSARSCETKDELSTDRVNYVPDGRVNDNDDSVSSARQSPPENNRSYYLAEKLAQSKKRNTILYSLLKQIELLNNKSENRKSLDLFFKSVSVDIEDLCPRAIDDVKPKILKCVAVVRDTYHRSSTADGSPPMADRYCSRSDDNDDETVVRHRQPTETIHNTLEIARSTDLFFKSVSADVEDFCARAIDDVKLGILKCVAEVKEIYSNREIPSPSPSDGGNSTSIYSTSYASPAVVNRNTATAAAAAATVNRNMTAAAAAAVVNRNMAAAAAVNRNAAVVNRNMTAAAAAAATLPAPVTRGQGYITYYSVPTVPLYCAEPSNFNLSYF